MGANATRVLLSLEAHDPSVREALLGAGLHNEAGVGTRRPSGVGIRPASDTKFLTDPGPGWLEFALYISKGVADGVVAAWLYDKLKGRVRRASVQGRDTGLSEFDLALAIRDARRAAERESRDTLAE